MIQVSVEDARALLSGPERPQLVDCREAWELDLCCIPGAAHIPLGEIVERGPAELDPAVPVLVYCHAGVRSIGAAVLLESKGFRAMSMRGGIDAWSVRVDPSVPRY